MISRIRGKILKIQPNRCELNCGALIYEVLIPGYVEDRLRKETGNRIEFFVHHYLEGIQSGKAVPRLVGFLSDGTQSC